MSAELRPTAPANLMRMHNQPPAQRRPAVLYLANLRPSGRRTMHAALDKIAGLLTQGQADAEWCPWHLVRYEHAAAVRAVLASTYAPATVNRHLTALRGVVRECWRLGMIPAEIRQQVEDVPGVKASTLPAGRMLSREELTRLWEGCSERDRALMALLFAGGLRRSEAARVTCEDLEEIEGGALRVYVWGGKGGKDRTVTIAGAYASALHRRLRERKVGRFLGLGPTGIYERLRKALAVLQLPTASPHDLRRSFISHALDAGVDLATVARMAGHADPRTTARYDRRGEKAEEAAADRLVDFLGRADP